MTDDNGNFLAGLSARYGLGGRFLRTVFATAFLIPLMIAIFFGIGILLSGDLLAAAGTIAMVTLVGMATAAMVLIFGFIPMCFVWAMTFRFCHLRGSSDLFAARIGVLTAGAVATATLAAIIQVRTGLGSLAGGAPTLIFCWMITSLVGWFVTRDFHVETTA